MGRHRAPEDEIDKLMAMFAEPENCDHHPHKVCEGCQLAHGRHAHQGRA